MDEWILATKILSENIYCCIATASKKGMPWNTPVFYSYDQDVNLYWASAMNSIHSQFLKENPLAFIVIYHSSAPPRSASGLYLQGQVDRVKDEKLDDVVTQHFKRVNEDLLFTADYYRGSSPERLYQFTPQKAWILGEPVNQHGHPVDCRKELFLSEFKKHLENNHSSTAVSNSA